MARQFFGSILRQARQLGRMSSERLSVDGSMAEGRPSQKSHRPNQGQVGSGRVKEGRPESGVRLPGTAVEEQQGRVGSRAGGAEVEEEPDGGSERERSRAWAGVEPAGADWESWGDARLRVGVAGGGGGYGAGDSGMDEAVDVKARSGRRQEGVCWAEEGAQRDTPWGRTDAGSTVLWMGGSGGTRAVE